MTIETIKRTIDNFGMVQPGEKVLVALSGGPDSVCLLHALHALVPELGITLHAAHLDHMFRGKESADEARFAASIAGRLNVPFTVGSVDVPAYCRDRGLSAQAGAREVRYRFLQQVCDEAGASRIALGHTASDQAETLLMRLLRGAGLAGLSGIPPVRNNIIRPLIAVTRDEILEYLNAKGLSFVRDPSNASNAYTRNRIRIELMPVLETFNPRIADTLAAEAALLRDENEAMEVQLRSAAGSVMTLGKDNMVLDRAGFEQLHPALKRRLLRAALSTAGAEPADVSSVQIEEALRFLSAAQTGRAMRLPKGLELTREYGRFLLGVAREARECLVELAVPGVTDIPSLGLSVETTFSNGPLPEDRDSGAQENYGWQALFDYDKIRPPLFLRTRRQGDRFQPAGMAGRSKKLQDFLVDEKVPRTKRDALPIVATEQEVLWIVGMRTDERFLPGPGTKQLLLVHVRKAP
jgi:tRNA(Ile)-lysidine synthase